MRLIFHPSLLASFLIALLPSFSSASVVSPKNEVVDEQGSAPLWQDKAAAPETQSNRNATSRSGKDVAITYPSRLVYYVNEESESTYHDLDTRTRNQATESQAIHLAQASFQLDAFGSTFTLDLTLNNDLLSSNYVEIHYEKDKPVFSKGGEHCYYHGKVRGKEPSHVALSTCNGLHGMFDDGVFVYLIAPLNQTQAAGTRSRAHTLHRTSSLGMGRDPADLDSEGQGEYEEEEEQILSNMPWLRRRRKRAVPQKVFDEIKYLEIMIVSDHNTFKRHKSKKHTRNFAKSVVNLVDAIFKEQLNTRVVLVAVEIWTDRDRIPLSVKPLDMLKDFSKYRQQNIGVNADAVHLFTNVTFHYGRSSMAYIGGVCSVGRGVGVNEFGSTWTMAASLSQSLAQNLGIQWDPVSRRKECGCMDSWVGCIMEDTGVQHPRRFSKCSITDFKNFLLKGGASCLFNRPNKLFEATECGNGYVEVGEECDCGTRMECYKDCCKKCSLSNGAHCSDGPCCNSTCLFLPRGYGCRYSVNDCDISESCSGDSGQCPPNLHKQDGYPCQLNQGRCYGGECKTRDNQCKYIWGSKAGGSEKHCYEKLNTEGTDKGNCGKDREKWIPCSKHDVFCGYLLCTNIGRNPRIGTLKGDITPTTFNHQGRLVDCSGGRVLLDDDTDLGYVEDGTPCGPSMMCLEKKCVPISSLNLTACPSGPNGRVCSSHGVCNNEATCTCDATWAGTDCSMHDPPKEPPAVEDEGPKAMETLRVNKVFLMNTLSADVGYILQHVQQEEIITLRDYRNLNHRNYTNETIVTNLLDCVLHKGPPVCARFVNLLQQREIQETFPQLKQLFSHAPPSHVQDNPERAADEIAEYKMSSIPRGFCLIINNIEFDQLKTRQGSTADEESLKEVFQWLGYSLDVYINQTAQQMKDLLKTYSQKEHSGDSFVCCILSHGLEGGVYGTDGNTICTNDIFRPFNGTSCRSLVNKPKAFFIQACCGDEFQLAVTVQSDNYEEMEAEVEMKDEEMLKMNAVAMITIPSDADCLVAMSTVKGYVSFRDSIRGSWFIQSLYKQLKKYCPKGIDVPTILLSVNQEVGEKVVKYKAKHLVKQMPVHKVTLRKKLVFHVPNQQ